jgi:2-polyprenyl-6-hydroxyphenyl methylase/3-demethylubiquinone-9 3-methyltransferase
LRRFFAQLEAMGGLVCPSCVSGLALEADALRCRNCGRGYPILGGVPDLRLEPDRFLSLEEDRSKGMAVLERAGGRGYRAALEAYWSLTPELEPALAQAHLRRQLFELEAGTHLLREIERRCGPIEGLVLDAGCGLGGFVAAAAGRGLQAVGIDAAFRWALVARVLLEEIGVDAPILCANAEHPPFRPGTFGLVVANDLVEHVRDAQEAVASVARMVRPGGALYVASTHRYSLAPEPHVRLLGVGWLPRRWQSAYVRLRRGHAYDRVRPVSPGELRAWIETAGLRAGPAFAAPVFGEHLRPSVRTGLRLLERARWGAPRIGVVGR